MIDDGYTFEWGPFSVPVPTFFGEWIDDLLERPERMHRAMFFMGFLTGLVTALGALLLGFYIAYS